MLEKLSLTYLLDFMLNLTKMFHSYESPNKGATFENGILLRIRAHPKRIKASKNKSFVSISNEKNL